MAFIAFMNHIVTNTGMQYLPMYLSHAHVCVFCVCLCKDFQHKVKI